MISETINRIIPKRSPSCTAVVCCPSNVASRTTSRHQILALIVVIISPRKNRTRPPLKLCMCLVRPNTIKKAENPVASGHGLGSTI